MIKFKNWIPLVVVILISCNNEEAEVKDQPVEPPIAKEKVIDVEVPEFSEDSAYHFIQKQVDFGPRVPNSLEHAECAKWLESKLSGYGFNTMVQTGVVTAWNGQELILKNIIGQYKPELKDRILLCAHWDTRPYADKDSTNQYKPIDGANDGASGVGVLLEIARQLNQNSKEYGVDIIFFDAEDYGTFDSPQFQVKGTYGKDWCLGSQYFCNNPPIANYSPNYGILLDMVGAEGATFPKEGVSRYFANNFVIDVWNEAASLGYEEYFVNQIAGEITDDHTFLNTMCKIKTIDIIDMDVSGAQWSFGSFHHTHDDNMGVINKNTLKAVGQTVLSVVYKEI